MPAKTAKKPKLLLLDGYSLAFRAFFALPEDLTTTLLFVVSLVFSFFVFFHIGFLLGTLSVITLDIRSIAWAYYSFVSFFSGQIVPLWLFPDFLRKIAEWLPFQAVYYIPMSIYIKRLSGSTALQAVGIQVFWAIVLALFARWAWTRVHTRLTVQGG